ncbi:MAG TPA: hypothetical protein PLC07_07860 [Bacillota bacterium]|nr:hypothetical protein [Bacillota bacterium]HPT87207.1 hypothetical protein [Bacillota bacterium]
MVLPEHDRLRFVFAVGKVYGHFGKDLGILSFFMTGKGLMNLPDPSNDAIIHMNPSNHHNGDSSVMYTFLLIGTALLFISVFSTNWPVKLYHRHFLMKLARRLDVPLKSHGLLFSSVYSELSFEHQGQKVTVRFLEGTMDALYSNSGLEIRLQGAWDGVVELYRPNLKKRAWGDFKPVHTGDPELDKTWFIISPEPEWAAGFIRHWLTIPMHNWRYLEQILVNRSEVVLRLRRVFSVSKLHEVLMELLSKLRPEQA